MVRVMCVGIATLDIINRVEQYPAEDSEVRALAQSQRMGGNAANTATVLAQLGVQAFWVGNLEYIRTLAGPLRGAGAHRRLGSDRELPRSRREGRFA